MKSFLIVLFIVLLASGSQARQIPADSLYDYKENAQNELFTHIANFKQIVNNLPGEGINSQVASRIYDILPRILLYFDNLFTFFRLVHACDNAPLVCHGMEGNCLLVARDINLIQIGLSFTEHQLTAVQGNDAKKFIEQTLADFVDSIEDDDCREKVRLKIEEVRSTD